MLDPFFSIIITTKNRPEFLKTSIDSVLRQSFQNFEILIVNDGEKLSQNPIEGFDIKFFDNSGSGICSARNKGMKEAQGKYLIFLDDDEYFEQSHLENLAQFYNNNDPQVILKAGTKLLSEGKYIVEGKFTDSKALLPQIWKYGASMSDYCFPSEIKNSVSFDEEAKVTNDFLFLNMAFCFFPQRFLNLNSVIVPDHPQRISYFKFQHPLEYCKAELNVILNSVSFLCKMKLPQKISLRMQLTKAWKTTLVYFTHSIKQSKFLSSMNVLGLCFNTTLRLIELATLKSS